MKYNAPDSSPMCDECGKTNLKIARVENNHRYCTKCYVRVFRVSACPSCKKLARLNKYNKNAICAACIRAKPCARCGKAKYKTGKLTSYGMVCNSCAPHYKVKEPCELCGTSSNRLSKNSRLGNNLRLCPKCIRADHGTCQACNRHRLLTLNNGKMLCRTCSEQGEKPCSKCNQLMPAGYGNTCEICYWKGLLNKRVAINFASFSVVDMANHFSQFSLWLSQEVGFHKAAITINRYVPFFMEIEKQFKIIPNYVDLLEYFGAAKLRKFLLPMRWMESNGLIIVDPTAREDNSEKRRISALLEKTGFDTSESKLLNDYYQSLLVDLKLTKTTLRSIRLALSPATSLLVMGAEMKLTPPNQRVLDTYLQKSAGQRSAVSGFVNYLRDTHGIKLVLPKLDAGKAQLNRRKRLETEMLALLKCAGSNDELNRDWLSVALAYFHGLPRKVGKTLPTQNIVDAGDGGISVIYNGHNYWIVDKQLSAV